MDLPDIRVIVTKNNMQIYHVLEMMVGASPKWISFIQERFT